MIASWGIGKAFIEVAGLSIVMGICCTLQINASRSTSCVIVVVNIVSIYCRYAIQHSNTFAHSHIQYSYTYGKDSNVGKH